MGIIAKLLTPLIGGMASNVIRAVVIAAFLGIGGFAWLTVHDSHIYAKAIKECPPQSLYTGNPVVNNFPPKKMRCLPFAIGRWGLGICHD